MLNTKYLYQFTDIIKRPTIVKTTRYMENYERLEDECSISQLFYLLYGERYYVDRIRPFKVVLTRGVA